MTQHIKNACLKWLGPLERMAEEVTQDVCVEHYIALLPYKPKWWVTCHQPRMLEKIILLMEAYMSAEAGIYLWKNLQRQANQNESP